MSDGVTDEVVVEAARAVRAYLGDLLSEGDDRAGFDCELVAALRRAPVENVEEDFDRLFESRPAVRDWVAVFYEYGVPPDLVDVTERSVRLPGDPAPLALPDLYVCPVDGNYSRYVRLAFASPGTCPDHPGVALVLAPPTRS